MPTSAESIDNEVVGEIASVLELEISGPVELLFLTDS